MEEGEAKPSSRPTSAKTGSRPTSAKAGSRPASAKTGSRPTSAKPGELHQWSMSESVPDIHLIITFR